MEARARRGHQARRELHVEEQKKEHLLEASFRGKKARKKNQHHHHHHKSNRNKHHHRRNHDGFVPEDEYDDEHKKIATKLQSLQRGKKARERVRYHNENDKKEYEEVAIKIQAIQRGRAGRGKASERQRLHRE